MKAQIAQKARDLGFDACRVTTAEPPTHADVFREWIAARRHGAMGYLAERYHELSPKQISELRVLGERFSQPAKVKAAV